jgi:hypothetical protein
MLMPASDSLATGSKVRSEHSKGAYLMATPQRLKAALRLVQPEQADNAIISSLQSVIARP